MKVHVIVLVLLILFSSLLIINQKAKAVYFASDSVTIYEGNNKVIDACLFYIVSYGSHAEVCNDEVCSIGQQYYPVTIYKINNDVLNSEELNSSLLSIRDPYKNYDNCELLARYSSGGYLEFVRSNSEYSIVFNPGPSESESEPKTKLKLFKDNEPDCAGFGCVTGGRIGDPRSYNLDIVSGDYKQTDVLINNLRTINLPLIIGSVICCLSVFVILSIVIILFVRLKKKEEWKHSTGTKT